MKLLLVRRNTTVVVGVVGAVVGAVVGVVGGLQLKNTLQSEALTTTSTTSSFPFLEAHDHFADPHRLRLAVRLADAVQ